MNHPFDVAVHSGNSVILGVNYKVRARCVGNVAARPIPAINDQTTGLLWEAASCMLFSLKPEVEHLGIRQMAKDRRQAQSLHL